MFNKISCNNGILFSTASRTDINSLRLPSNDLFAIRMRKWCIAQAHIFKINNYYITLPVNTIEQSIYTNLYGEF